MTWQELILTGGTFISIFSLFPSVLSKDKPALLTSLINGGILAAFVITYISLQLYITALSCFLLGLLWFVLAFQKFRTKSH